MLLDLRFKKRLQHEVYSSIDELPVKVWFDVLTDGDLSLIIKKGKIKKKELILAWENLYNEYINRFGLSEGFKKNFEINKLESMLAKISKFYGFKLDSRDLTTTEYYSYLENITNG